MKIIQSYARFDEGSPYLIFEEDKKKLNLNFYSFFLSFLTLQKYYHSVTMYCNQKAYDSLIKYIPYNEINVVENKNSFVFWNMYKIDAMKAMTEKFVHIDSDVFIFDNLFDEFIYSDKYDVIVQDILPPEKNFIRDFVKKNKSFLLESKIINPDVYDDRCVSCGTIGMTIEIRNEYIKVVEVIQKAYEMGLLIDANPMAMVGEELGMYLFILKNKLSVFDVLPYDQIKIHGVKEIGNRKKYTHLWLNTKFNLEYIELIKNKIKKEFPEYYDLIRVYELNVIEKNKI